MERSDPTYVDTLRFLLDRINYERTDDRPYDVQSFRLGRMAYLLERLGNPQWTAPVIHIAGTKGKGSVAWLVAEMLRHAGFRTGLYTSPHLEHLEERFVVNGAPVTPDTLLAPIPLLRSAAAECTASEHGPPTFFELTTALAWLLFRCEKTQVNVVEVGLGGRLDSTNVCDPAVSIITSISYDHQQQLGDTLDKIAFEKAGIIKNDVPVIHGARAPEAARVIRQVAHERNAELWELGRDFQSSVTAIRHDLTQPWPAPDHHNPSPNHQHPSTGQPATSLYPTPTSPLPTPNDLASQAFTFTSMNPALLAPEPVTMPLRMAGGHQGDNAALAVATWARLRRDGWAISAAALRAALGQTQVPARIETIPWNPYLIIDTAHNEASMKALLNSLDDHWTASRRTLIFACSKDKKIREMLELMLPAAERLIVTQFHSNPRAVPVELLEATARTMAESMTRPAQIFSVPNVELALDFVQRKPLPGELICVTGSFFIAAEARAAARHLST
jgi:dihydrofolate synthase / folylpolyglutamate synthase